MGCLWGGVSAHTNAETFLNDSTLLQQKPEYTQSVGLEITDERQYIGKDNAESVISIKPKRGHAPATELPAPLNQGVQV